MNRRDFLQMCGWAGAAGLLPGRAFGRCRQVCMDTDKEGGVDPGCTPQCGPMALGWYCWRGGDWLMLPEMLGQLPAGTRRLLLSFTATELAAFWPSPAALRSFAKAARKRGIALEWLVGDPTYALPQGCLALKKLAGKMPAGVFSAIHLDLERAQLPAAQQDGWEDGAIAAVRAAHEAGGLPVGLTTHHRDLRDPAFIQRLAESGAKEAVPMVYAANPARVLEIVQALPRTGALAMGIAQSVEKALPPDEGTFALGRKKSLAHWRALDLQFQQDESFGYDGILVQSWEDWRECKP
jgi:hypothetical protein